MGWTRLVAVTIRAAGRSRLLRADLLCVALEHRPAEELILQTRAIAGEGAQVSGQLASEAAAGRPELRVRVVRSAGGR